MLDLLGNFFSPNRYPQMGSVLVGSLTGFLASLLGWQINILAIHRAFHRSRTAAFFVGVGAAFGDIVFILIAFAGAASVFHRAEVWRVLKWVGIATLFAVAIKILFEKPKVHAEGTSKKRRNPPKNFLIGFLFVVTNPAVFLAWVGIMTFILTHFAEFEILSHRLWFLTAFVLGASLWFLMLLLLFLPSIKKWGEERVHLLSKWAVSLILIAGVWLILHKF